MDYTRWAETQHQHQHQHQQQQQQQQQYPSHHHPPPPPANDQYYNAQPYNPYPYQPNPTDTLTAPQKHPPTLYNNPPTLHDLGHSDASLAPPGMDPYGHAGVIDHNSYAPHVGHQHMSSSVPDLGYLQQPQPQVWETSDPGRQYGADPVIYGAAGIPQNGMVQNQTMNPNMIAWNNQMYPGPGLLRRPWQKGLKKKTKVVQSVHCEVCNLDCNCKDAYDAHKVGKKHKKNVEKLQEAQNQMKAAVIGPTTTIISAQVKPTLNLASPGKRQMALDSVTPANLVTKRMKLMESGAAAAAVRICEICNLVCNSQTVFEFHLAGKKHAAQLQKQAVVVTGVTTGDGVGTPRVVSTVFPASVNGAAKKKQKKTKVASQSAWCMTCHIDCNSKEMLDNHRAGQKHRKNVRKLKQPVQNQKKEAISAGVGGGSPPNASSAQVEPEKNLAEKTDVENGSGGVQAKQEDVNRVVVAPVAVVVPPAAVMVPPVAVVEDLDTKKRRLLVCGAKEDDLKVCAICNLVCNNPQGFEQHLAGKKHAAQVKKQAEIPGADAPLEFSSA